jgi:hypothetical protein
MRKGDENPKNERQRRPEMSREQEPVGIAKETTNTISGNSRKLLQTRPEKTTTYCNRKQDAIQKQSKGLYRRIGPFATAIVESEYFEVADQNTGTMPQHV